MTGFVRKRLQAAGEFLRSGDLARAEASIREILQRDPAQPDALHALGRIALQRGRDEEAVPLIQGALEHSPSSHQLRADLAVALQNLGRNEEAAVEAEHALRLKPDNLSALNTLGNALRAQGKQDEAVASFKSALRLGPGLPLLHLNLAAALDEAGRTGEALEACGHALGLAPRNAEALLLMSRLQRSAGLREQAEQSLLDAIAIRPTYAEALYNLGSLLRSDQRLEQAHEAFAQAVALKPDFADAHAHLAQLCSDLGRLDEAIDHFARVASLRPDHPGAQCDFGNALRERGRFDEAAEAYRRAVASRPDFAEAYCNLSTVRLDQGNYDDAVECSHRAIAAEADLPEAHWNLAQAYLTQGALLPGWHKYEYRLLKKDAAELSFPFPLWDGSSLAGKTLFVTAEQGVGDEIMFSSCVPDAMREAECTVLECDARLVPLFARSYPGARVVARLATADGYPAELPAPDARIAIGSLPMFFRRDLESFPERSSFLIPDPERVEMWRGRYAALGGGLKIGISWRGGKDALVRRARSIPLAEWAELAGLEGVHFVNLQYGDTRDEREAARRDSGLVVHHWFDADPLTDLDGLAAQIAALDLVLSVDNATVHLAGALGTPTWVMSPSTADWRWMTDRSDSPWYPSLRLHRQQAPGEWDTVMRTVRNELTAPRTEDAAVAALLSTRSDVGLQGASRKRAEWVAFLNDTSHWYHWGCTGTSTAIVETLRGRGYEVSRIPITGLQSCTGAPVSQTSSTIRPHSSDSCARTPGWRASSSPSTTW